MKKYRKKKLFDSTFSGKFSLLNIYVPIQTCKYTHIDIYIQTHIHLCIHTHVSRLYISTCYIYLLFLNFKLSKSLSIGNLVLHVSQFLFEFFLLYVSTFISLFLYLFYIEYYNIKYLFRIKQNSSCSFFILFYDYDDVFLKITLYLIYTLFIFQQGFFLYLHL